MSSSSSATTPSPTTATASSSPAIGDAVVERNDAIANDGNGISVDQPGNTLTRNHAIGNSGVGIAAPDGTIDGGRNRGHRQPRRRLHRGGVPMSTPCPPRAELGTILSVWAHPDDETYLAAGVMAAAADRGQRVVCVSATAGEHGTVRSRRPGHPPGSGGVRRWEAAAAMAVLGVAEHRILGLARRRPRRPRRAGPRR